MTGRQSATPLEAMKIDLRGIGDAMKSSRLQVPPYQRDYSWEEEQVEELLGDIDEAIRTNEPEYFLGSIVLSMGLSGSLHVTDGQQRLATTSIILAAIRDYFLVHGESERALELESEFLLTRDRRTRDVIPRLRLNAHDHGYYEAAVLTKPSSQQLPSAEATSHKRLRKGVSTVRDYIGRLASVHPKDPVSALLDWVEYLEKRCKVIWVIVPDEGNAFTIFETLNDRGLDLAISDLLKNFLFHTAGPRLDEAQNHWTTMTGILEATSEEEVLVTYLRHYWSSVQGLTRERDLYKNVKRKVSTPAAAVELAKSLCSSSVKYAALSNTSHEMWGDYGVTTQGHIATLNLLRMVQMRPLLLSIVDVLPPAEGVKAIKYLVDFAVRILVVGARGGTVETTYCDAAKGIREGRIKSAAGLRKTMSAVFPADGEFREAFAVATVSKTYLARYYLRALEQAASGTAHPEFVPNPNTDDVNLEHVIPLRPGKNWTHLSEDDCAALYRRLGNMALLMSTDNRMAGNSGFSVKKAILGRSSFKTTKEIAAQNAWTDKEIAARQKTLANLAVRTWSGKFS